MDYTTITNIFKKYGRNQVLKRSDHSMSLLMILLKKAFTTLVPSRVWKPKAILLQDNIFTRLKRFRKNSSNLILTHTLI